MSGALANLKVIEYGELISAPFCARLMADLGAEVIKVESPAGDPARRMGPFPDDLPHPEKSGLFHYLNFNKLGITLSMDTATGRSLLGRLLKSADVFVTSMSYESAQRLRLKYEDVKEINPRLVLTTATPFGWSGPYRDYQGNAAILAHVGGWAYLNPRLAPSEQVPPLTPPGRLAEFNAGLLAASGTLLAMFKRNRSGSGQQVDVSAHECTVTVIKQQFARYSATGQVDSRVGRSFAAPFHVLPCKDGYVYVWCEQEDQWRRFVELMGNPDWAKADLFSDRYRRAENWEALEDLLKAWFCQYTKEEIYHRTQRHRIPFGTVGTARDVRESRQLSARGFFVPIEHPDMGTINYPGAPFRLSATPWRVGRPAPRLGEHNEQVYHERLGLPKTDLVSLRQAGII